MCVGQGEAAYLLRRRQPLQPLLPGPLRRPAQDGVDVSARPVRGEVDGGRDSGVCRCPEVEQLVCAEAEQCEDRRLETGQRPTAANPEHRVQTPLPAQRAVGAVSYTHLTLPTKRIV